MPTTIPPATGSTSPPRQRRVALIAPGFSQSEEDWCIPALLDLVRVLSRYDDVTVFALRYPHQRKTYSVHGAVVIPFSGEQARGLARLPFSVRAISALWRQAKPRRFDVIHALWAHEPGFLAVVAGRLLRTPTVVSLLGGELVDLPDIDYGGLRSATNRWLTRQALKRADLVTIGSPFLAELTHRFQVSPTTRKACPEKTQDSPSEPTESAAVMPLGVDLERFHPRPETRRADLELIGEPKLLQVASLIPVKDQVTLLKAFHRLVSTHPRAHLHLIGEGVEEQRLRDLVRELTLVENVTFHGAIDHDRLPSVYRQADLLVVSSRFESQGMVMLEALACGCQVAGTTVGLMPELAPPAHTCPPQDARELERAMLRALAERPDVEEKERRARQLAMTYGLEATVKRWRNAYATVERQFFAH